MRPMLPLLLLLLCRPAWLPAQARSLTAYGIVTDLFGTPVPGARIGVTAVDVSPGVEPRERTAVGPGQCSGARPTSAGAVVGADGRFRVVLRLDAPVPALLCLAVEVVPPRGTPLGPIYLAMDSVEAGKLTAAGDSVRMNLIVPEGSFGVPDENPPPAPPASFASEDEELVWLARAVPGGFGGYWRPGPNQPMNVYLTDMTLAPRAKKVLLKYFHLRPPTGGEPPDVQFMRGRWDVLTLIGWRDRLRAAGAAAGVRAADLRLDWNRVQVTMRAEGRSPLLARLPALGIPQAALFLVGR